MEPDEVIVYTRRQNYRDDGGAKLTAAALKSGMCPYHTGAPIARMLHQKNKKHFCYLCASKVGDTKPHRKAYKEAKAELSEASEAHKAKETKASTARLEAATTRFNETKVWESILKDAKEKATRF